MVWDRAVKWGRGMGGGEGQWNRVSMWINGIE